VQFFTFGNVAFNQFVSARDAIHVTSRTSNVSQPYCTR